MEQPRWYYAVLRISIIDQRIAIAVDQRSNRTTEPRRRRRRLGLPLPMALAAMALPLLGTARGRALLTGALPRSLRAGTGLWRLPASGRVRPGLPSGPV